MQLVTHGTKQSTNICGKKYCKYCSETKPVSSFIIKSQKRKNGDYVAQKCRACRTLAARRSRRRVRLAGMADGSLDSFGMKPGWLTYANTLRGSYGLDYWDFVDMHVEQRCRCKICGIHEVDCGKLGLVVDHCHESGAVRGLLCSSCNSILGMSRDSISVLQMAVKYLALTGTSKDGHALPS